MTYPDIIQATVDRCCRAAEMRKHSGAWYGESTEVWTVVQLQRSQYARSYFLNTGFWLRAMGDKPYPKEREFHIRARAEALAPELDAELSALLDLDVPLADAERVERLQRILETVVLPTLRRGSTVRGLQEMYAAEQFVAAAVRGEALTLLRTT